MGVIAKALKPQNLSVNVGSGGVGFAQSSGGYGNSFLATSRAYMGNEILSSGINLLASSAAEPHIIGRRWRRNRRQIQSQARALAGVGITNRAGAWRANTYLVRNGFYEEVDDHPLVKLLNNPNPHMSRGQFWSQIVMYYYLAGNAYALKARYQGGLLDGAVGELWPLRPDRVKPVPGDMSKGEQFVKAYEYATAEGKKLIPASDIMHFKTRHPLTPYEGMSPIASILPRIAIDTYMRTFLSTFFERGGAGAGANLNVKGKMEQSDKDGLRERFRRMFSGGQFDVLVTAADDVTYTPFSLNRGLRDALPKEIDAVNEARIAMVLGIPGSILGLLIGYESSSYANKRQDWQVLWDVTMTPLLSDLDDELNLSLVPEFGGIDEVLFDLSDIRALQEDEDKLQDRARKNFQVGLWSFEESRMMTGQDAVPPPDGTFFVPGSSFPTRYEYLTEEHTRKHVEQGADPGGGPENTLLRAVRMLMPPPDVDGRRGRLRLEDDPEAHADYEEAMRLKAQFPGMTWAQVASRIGRSERQLRELRARLSDDESDE